MAYNNTRKSTNCLKNVRKVSFFMVLATTTIFLTNLPSTNGNQVSPEPLENVTETHQKFHQNYNELQETIKKTENYLVANTLNYMAFLEPSKISLHLLRLLLSQENVSKADLLDVLGILAKHSMVSEVDGPDHYKIEPIVQEMVLQKLSKNDQVFSQLINKLIKVLPVLEQSVSTDVLEQLEHVLFTHAIEKLDDPDVYKFAKGLASYTTDLQPMRAKILLEILLAHQRANLVENNPPEMDVETIEEIIRLNNGLAMLLERVGEFAIAMKVVQGSLEEFEKLLGGKNVNILWTKERQGRILTAEGKLDEALPVLTTVLEELQKLQKEGADLQLQVEEAKRSIGDIHFRKQNHKEAIKIFKELLEATVARSGNRSQSTLRTKSNLALAYKQAGDLTLAGQMFIEILQVEEPLLGGSHPHVLIMKENLASVLYEQRQFEDSFEIYEHVLELQMLQVGGKHPSVLMTKSDLAITLYAMGDRQEGMEMLGEAIALMDEVFGPDHPNTLNKKVIFGKNFIENGQFEEGIKILSFVLSIREKTLDSDHPGVIALKEAVEAAKKMQLLKKTKNEL